MTGSYTDLSMLIPGMAAKGDPMNMNNGLSSPITIKPCLKK